MYIVEKMAAEVHLNAWLLHNHMIDANEGGN